MNRSRWIWVALFGVFALAAIYVGTNPQMASRYAHAQRDAALGADAKEMIMVVIAVALIAYFGWFFMIRKD